MSAEPGMLRDQRMTWRDLGLLMAAGAIVWVGMWHVGRDIYRLLMDLPGCE